MVNARTRRGSVLLMAVGLLTIIALLASMFLIVAQLDATEFQIMASKDQANTVAQGIMTMVAGKIGDDRWKASTGTNDQPYSAFLTSPTNGSQWVKYIDYPSAAAGGDTWLSSTWSNTDPNKHAYITNIGGTGALFDTDLDGTPDAYRVRSDSKISLDSTDRYFWYAVHVSDLSGKICLNTAGRDPCQAGVTGLPALVTPVYMNLQGLLGTSTSTLYNTIHGMRCNGVQTVTFSQYYNNCGSVLLTPATTAYTPFSIGDEMCLLWKPLSTEKPMTNVGRLGVALPNTVATQVATQNLKRFLTTFSCTDTFVRRPDVGSSADPDPNMLFVDGSVDRQALYRRVLRMLYFFRAGTNNPSLLSSTGFATSGALGPTAIHKRMAAHFVANLWAYMCTGDANRPWSFQPTGEAFTVYGLKQDLVIGEAFAKHKADGDTATGKSDHYWGYAVELLNPTASSITVNTTNYAIKMNGAVITPTSAFTVPAATSTYPGRKVLYDCGWGNSTTNPITATTIFGVDPNAAAGGPWVRVTGLDFSGVSPRKFQLFRKSGGVEVPVDEVTSASTELNYSCPNKDVPAGIATSPTTADIRRDDRMTVGTTETRARYNVAAYKSFTSHALNAAKLLDDTHLLTSTSAPDAVATYSCPIREADVVNTTTGERAIRSIGELFNIYFTGPIADGSTVVGFPQRIIAVKSNSALFNDTPTRGRLTPASFTAASTRSVVLDGFMATGQPSLYPDLPAATFFNEFLTLLRPHDSGLLREKSRIYGLLNVNTASRETLRYLPWPTTIRHAGTTVSINNTEKEIAIDYLLSYRDKKQIGSSPNYFGSRQSILINSINRTITSLRMNSSSNTGGFLTPGEVAIPLGDYMSSRLGYSAAPSKSADYWRARDALYSAIANCITTRSNTYAVYMRVDLEGSPYVWYYVGVVDRSNCLKRDDFPAILLFTEVR